MQKQFIVICAQIVGGGPFQTEYSFDGKRFDYRESAIRHGFELGRSDDFNIGVLKNGALVSLDWMFGIIDQDPDFMARISKEIFL
jgi:hypothetical protein